MERWLALPLMAVSLWGQTSIFEAASVKLSDPGKTGSGINVMPARIRVINASLKFCVQVAWNVKDFQVSGGPAWADTTRFDIEAVAAHPFEAEEYRGMLQALLTDRFGLTFHRAMQDRDGYVLLAGRNGPKLPPPIESPSFLFSMTPSGDRTLEATSATMKRLASGIASLLGVTVVDGTGLEGQFDVSLQFAPDPSSRPTRTKSGEPLPPPPPDAVPGPTLFEVLQEKLGLKLEPRKLPIEVIVIDRAEKPTGN